VRDADAERKADPKDPLLEYAYILALNEAPVAQQSHSAWTSLWLKPTFLRVKWGAMLSIRLS